MAGEELEGPNLFSWNLATETPIDIDTLILALSPNDLPLMTGVGSDGVPLLGNAPLHNTYFSWLEKTVPLPRGTLAADATNVAGTITVAAGDAVKFANGDQLLIDSEVMLVTDIDTTTEVITVTRGSAGTTNTTAAAHTAGAEILGMGSLLIEGSIGSHNFQGRDKEGNYAQIFSKRMGMSATAQLIPKYGIPSELNEQMAGMMQHELLGIEHAAMYGVRNIVSATQRRQTGGLNFFITSNVNTADEWLTVDSITEQQQNAYNKGGQFEVIVAQPGAYGALNNITGGERITTVTVDDPRRGRQRATTVMTEYGTVELARSRWVRKSDAFGYSRANFLRRTLRPLQTLKLAKTDDTDSWFIVTELGFEVKGEDHMAKWTGLDPSAAYPGAGLV